MNHQYDYRINPQVPSNERISRHKDFNALLETYRKTAPVRRLRLTKWLAISGTIAAGVAILLMVFVTGGDSYEKKAAEYFASKPYLDPPLQQVEKHFQEEKIIAEKGGVIKGKNGSRYTLAKDALTDEQGNPVSGEVIIKYREMHDYVDFFLSGIPMTYDSAGKQWQFESAGMVEIFAEQEGKRINLSPEKPIKVELVSQIPLKRNQPVPKYNIYKLDPAARNWVYQDVDNIQLVEEQEMAEGQQHVFPEDKYLDEKLSNNLKELQSREQKAIAEAEAGVSLPPAPVKPQRANGSSFVFDLDFEGDDLLASSNVSQEESDKLFRQYRGALWQVKPGEAVSSDDLKKNWDDAKIRPLGSNDFELLLIKDGKEFQVVVNPVLSGQQYREALTDYENEMADYEKTKEEKYAMLKPRLNQIRQQFAEERESMYEKMMGQSADEDFFKVNVINRFTLSSFGVWNCDRPFLPEENHVEGELVDDKQNKYDNHTAYLVDKNKNTITKFYASKGCKVRFNEKSENLLWVVTPDNKIALFRPEDFEDLKSEGKEDDYSTLVMNVVDRPIQSEADIREILHF